MHLTDTLQKGVLYCAAAEFVWVAVRAMTRRIRRKRACACRCHQEG